VAYATQTNITDRYGANYLLDAADRDGDDAVDTAAVTEALDDATSEMDSFIGRQYPLPLVTTPTWFVICCVDLAVCQLASENRGSMTERIAAKCERWRDRLLRVSKGEQLLGLATEPSTHFEDALTSDTPLMHPSSTEGLV
jgi:phage gp36-like protein